MKILRNNKGSFLVEAMIGLTLSSFMVIAVLLIYKQAEENKMVVLQTNSIVDNTVLSLYPIKMGGLSAGWGMPFRDEIGCDVVGYNTSSNNEINFKLKPVDIISDLNNGDVLTFVKGGSYYALDRIKTTNIFYKNGTVLNLETSQKNAYENLLANIYKYEKAILFQPGKKCTLFHAGFKFNTTTNSYVENQLTRIDSYVDVDGYIANFYNKIGGLTNGEDYSVGSYVYMMGPIFNVESYFVRDNKLIQKNNLNNTEKIISDNVIAFIVKYGVDTNGDGNVDTLNKTEQDFYKIKTLNVSLLVKSPIKEKQKNGECITSKNNLVKLIDEEIDLSSIVGSDWGCYRYRAFSEEIELRNIRWTPKLN